MGMVIDRQGPPLDVNEFVSMESGAPGSDTEPHVFVVEAGKTKINAGLDSVIASMRPGERRLAIVPPALAYKVAGFYAPEVPGKKRLVISPNSMLVYEVESSGN
jgi:FKBP-type peptidyl-prolyl cis-trans isomerase